MNQVFDILNEHSRKAEVSEYDRSVSIKAVLTVRDWINANSPPTKKAIVDGIENLRSNYNDPDGVYTNGRGIIGSILDDLSAKLS